MSAYSEGSGESVRMRRLALAFAGRLCDKYHNLTIATVSKNFKSNLDGQNYVHFYVILSRNVKIFGIMAAL